jgi:uncharacterized protein (TIGR02145 family)
MLKLIKQFLFLFILFLIASCGASSPEKKSDGSIDSTIETDPNIEKPTSEIIKIGDQTWTTKNLDVSTFRNGDTIPEEKDAAMWKGMTTAAWCYQNHESLNGVKYGKLYNWYAVTDPRGLAPEGFHIPSNEEWRKLIDYLGGEEIAGEKMKSKSGWESYDDKTKSGNGSNSSGFTGIASGYRSAEATTIMDFDGIGYRCRWWSNSEAPDNFNETAYTTNLVFTSNSAYRDSTTKCDGQSVRCIKN